MCQWPYKSRAVVLWTPEVLSHPWQNLSLPRHQHVTEVEKTTCRLFFFLKKEKLWSDYFPVLYHCRGLRCERMLALLFPSSDNRLAWWTLNTSSRSPVQARTCSSSATQRAGQISSSRKRGLLPSMMPLAKKPQGHRELNVGWERGGSSLTARKCAWSIPEITS